MSQAFYRFHTGVTRYDGLTGHFETFFVKSCQENAKIGVQIDADKMALRANQIKAKRKLANQWLTS